MTTRWYRSGTITVTDGSKEVVGTNTFWIDSPIKPLAGDLMIITGELYEIEAITDNTHLTLFKAFSGNPPRGGEYAIIRNTSLNLTSRVAAMVAQIVNEKQNLFDLVEGFYTSDDAVIHFDLGNGMTTDVVPIKQLEENIRQLAAGISGATNNEITGFSATTLPAGQQASATWDRGTGIVTINIPRGANGTNGAPGHTDNRLVNIPTVGATQSLDVTQGSVFTMTLTEATTAITLTAQGADPTLAIQCLLILEQGSGSNKVAWGSNIKFPTSTPPHLSYTQGKKDTVALMSTDQGATWLAFLSGTGF
ncbi:TPA: hypothetical protein P0E30_003768 [Vibrio harveyi]|nr:hypothetical protein [Vibrio harveyi]